MVASSHMGLYAGSRDVVNNWYLGDAYATLVDEHFFVDMTPTGLSLYNLTYLNGLSKTGHNTWYHIEWKVQPADEPDEPVEEYGAIEVYKKDQNGSALAGAEFGVFDSTGALKYTIGPTNANGYATTNKELPYGTYKVVETVFPSNVNQNSGYQKEWTVTINENTPNGTFTINAVNETVGKIQIKKATNTGTSLTGWSFNVYTDAQCTQLYGSSPYTITDSSGVLTIENVPINWRDLFEPVSI